ncbi:MAG: aminopeptidase P family protein [Hyphomicrobiaceae bacterium]
MFQSFDNAPDPGVGAPRVRLLREELARLGLSGFIVPRADEHQGEYVPDCAARLRWVSGFSGSAGTAVILMDRAALFVDGRYTVQAREETDGAVFERLKVPEGKISDWLAAHAGAGAKIGYDPRLMTVDEVDRFHKALDDKGIALVATDGNPVDAVWADRPAPPRAQVSLHPIEHAGASPAEKLEVVQAELAMTGHDAAVLTAPDSIAWLLNIRGGDLPHTPFPLSFAIVPADGKPQLYIDPGKLGDNVRGALAAIAELARPDELTQGLTDLASRKSRVRLDFESTAVWFKSTLEAAGATVIKGTDPCLLPKARKSAAEIKGARAAQKRDAVAVARFLAWFDREAPKGEIDEIAAVEALERFRRETRKLLDTSFDTIAGAGPHAAMPHYRVSRSSNIRIQPNSIFLIDSGGQYLDGTTDITRTIAVGTVSEEARLRNTLVLEGMIAVSTARFPKGTRGSDIDPYARRALWQAGLDFDHGTGHGVGSYLSVHEGPQRISRLATTPLEPGMIISNEPGYYKEGHYGIRIENLLVVTAPDVPEGGERPMMGFETLTLAPIDTRLVLISHLSAAARHWLNAYHARVRAEIGPLLDGEDRLWLERATTAI